MIIRKSIALNIILSFVTCGIFTLVWYYQIASDLYRLNNNLPTSPGTTLILHILTCGLYSYYVFYQWDKSLNGARTQRDLSPDDKGILYLVLHFFGLSLINLALLQTDLNDLADA